MTTSGDTPGGPPGASPGYGGAPSGVPTGPGVPTGSGVSTGPGVPTSGAAQVGSAQPPHTPAAPRTEPRPEPRPEPRKPAAAANPAAAQPLRAGTGKARRARLVVRRVDPWSVLKFSLLFSLCLLVVFVVAVAALFYALQALGVFDSVNEFVRDLTQANSGGRTTGGVEVPFTATRVIGVAAVIGLINVVLITAISTLGAFLYNLCSDIVGGIEVTLAERD